MAGIHHTQRFGTKTRREIGCSTPHSALWEGLKLVEITAGSPAQERGFHLTPKFSLHRNDGKLGMGLTGVGNTQPWPRSQVPPKPRNPQPLPGLTCWQRRRPRGSEGRGCPRRRSARRGLGCSCAVMATGKRLSCCPGREAELPALSTAFINKQHSWSARHIQWNPAGTGCMPSVSHKIHTQR